MNEPEEGRSMNFVDLQVNGYAGVDFNAGPINEKQIQLVADRLRAGGVDVILPTITTDDLGLMAGRLSNLRSLIDQDQSLRRLMPAFHIEGPCLSPVEGYRGCHPVEHIVPAKQELIEPLVEAAGGPDRVSIVTLAPEVDKGLVATRWLAGLGIHVAAGHTDASLELLREAEQVGLSLFTHLGNGNAAQMDRHDNIVYRAMSLEQIRYTLIPDGHHLPFWLVKKWVHWIGVDRCMFITDCINAADAPEDLDMPEWREIDGSSGTPVARLKGTPYLAGAALTMKQGYSNAMKHVGLSEAEATTLCCKRPRKFIQKWLR